MPRLKKIATGPKEFSEAYNEAILALSRLLKMKGGGGITIHWHSGIPMICLDKPRSTEDDLLGVLDNALLQGSSAVVSIWSGPPSAETDTGRNETCWDWLLGTGDAIAPGTPVVIRRFPNGAFYVVAAGCSG